MLIKHLSFFLGQSRDLKMFKSYSPLLGLQTSVVSYLHFTLSFNSKGIFTNLQSQSLFEFTHMFTDFPCSPLIICISDISDLFVLPQVWILEIPLRKVCCGELYVLVYLKITLYFFLERYFCWRYSSGCKLFSLIPLIKLSYCTLASILVKKSSVSLIINPL